jgi:hypothetical protein
MAGVPDPAALVAGIEREERDGDVVARLAAAVRTAADLRGAGDELLDHFVGAARAEGCSWSEIGGVLGISKQGAQQRFTGPAATLVHPWPGGFSADAQAVVAKAADEARALGHRYLGTEHLLLALFSERAGLAPRCLAALSLSRARVMERVNDLIGCGEDITGGPLGVTPRTKRVFEATRREARRVGHRCPEPEHLLLALYAVRPGVAGEILAELGATEERTRATLADLLAREAPEIAQRIRQPPRRRFSRRSS